MKTLDIKNDTKIATNPIDKVWKKTSTLVTKGRALLQIEKKGRVSLGQGRALRPVKTG
jgi:hypothetical protein